MTNKDKELIIARIFNVLSEDVQIQSGKFTISDTAPIIGSIGIKCDDFEVNLPLDVNILNFLCNKRLQGDISVVPIPGLLQMVENLLRYDFPNCTVVSKTDSRINFDEINEVETFKIALVSKTIHIVARFKQNNKNHIDNIDENVKTDTNSCTHRIAEIYDNIINSLISTTTDIPYHKQSLDAFYTDSNNKDHAEDTDKDIKKVNNNDIYETAETYNNAINNLISIAINIAYREQSLNIFYIDSNSIDISGLNSLCLSGKINVYYKFSDNSSTKYFLEMIEPIRGTEYNKINSDIDQYKRFVITLEEIRTKEPKGIIVVDIPEDIYCLLPNNPVEKIVKKLSPESNFKRQLSQLMEYLLSEDYSSLVEYLKVIELAPNNDIKEKLKSLAYDILMIQIEKYDNEEINNVIKKLEYIYNLVG